MNTYRQLVYMCLDELKLMSDDASFTEDHVAFLLDKYRAMLLKQRYSDIRRQVPESNYQTICLDLIEVPAIPDGPCDGGRYLRSKHKIPTLMNIGVTNVYPSSYYKGNISFISRDRMRYIGYNKYMKNVIYASLGPDNYLYLTSCNPQYIYLEGVRMTGIFETPLNTSKLLCDDFCSCDENKENKPCDPLDYNFPLEESIVPQVIQLVVKELAGPSWRPEDSNNNASDDLASLANFIARNTKSDLQKKMSE